MRARATRSPTPRSTGTVGPNLDDAFSSDKAAGLLGADDRGRRPRPDRLSGGADAGEPLPAARTRTTSRRTSRSAPATRSCGVTATKPAPGATATTDRPRADGAAAPARQGGLRDGRLRRLPHAQGRGLDRHRRPEPRPAEAVEGGGRAPGRGRRRRDAVVQGPAHARADQGGRDVRLERRRQVATSGERSSSGNRFSRRSHAKLLAEDEVRRVAGAEVDARRAPPSRSSRRSRAPCASRAASRAARGRAAGGSAAARAARCRCPRRCDDGRTCSSTISKCGGSSHSARCAAVSDARDALGPPLPVRAGVAVAEAGDLAAFARDEEDEVVARRVPRQPLARPLVGERAGAERGAMHVAQLACGAGAGRLLDSSQRGRRRDRRRRA